MHLLISIGAAICFTIGGIFMEFSKGLSQPIPSTFIYISFLAGASLQALATNSSGMGMTYILVLGIEAILAVVFSAFLFREGYSSLKLLGIFLVVVGIVFLRSENR
jgi:small multidrug resistance pump/quaternary ammonium compound-resistance protein SugE